MKRVPAQKVSLAQDGFYYCDGELFSGIAFTEFPDGTPRSESEYRDGLAWGCSRGWHSNGTLAFESEFFRDVLHGISREWLRSGRLVSEITAEYGITLHERAWDEQGRPVKEYQLKENDSNYTRLLEFRRLYGTES